jgi:integrative and conjugative element protein (TIGR02256 family)
MVFHRNDDFRLILPRDALTVIFNECDGFDHDETGGRVIGTFKESGGKLTLQVTGIIEAGPQAKRSATSFFQDGEHQERIFRQVERTHPEIEHLGNWHTHHVNGLSTLSDGDVATYRRTVNHQNHNTPFFYALLVVARRKSADPLRRYTVRHFIFRRGDERAYEIPQRLIKVVDTPLVWPSESMHENKQSPEPENIAPRPERVYDQDVLGTFYQGVRPFTSQKIGLYWRGPIELLDGSIVQVVLVEDSSSQLPTYSVVLREPPDALKTLAEQLATRDFPSARAALITTERSCNRVLYERRSR